MTASEDFKKELNQQDLSTKSIRNALTLALSQAIELKITTWIATPDSGSDTAKPGYRMQTHINLVDGDIRNEIGTEFLNQDSTRELQQFHLSQVVAGREIIRENLENLQQLFRILVGTLHHLSQDGTAPLNSPRLPAARR